MHRGKRRSSLGPDPVTPPPARRRYTEKGRLLIRKEQEAILKGYRIGEVLHSAYFDLEFPSIAAAGKRTCAGGGPRVEAGWGGQGVDPGGGRPLRQGGWAAASVAAAAAGRQQQRVQAAAGSVTEPLLP